MTTHVEHGTIHSAGFSLFGRLSAAMGAFVQAWSAEQIEAQKALELEIPDDIATRHIGTDEPPYLIPIANPYALLVAAMLAPRRIERDEL